MKAIDKEEAFESGAQPVGRATVSVMPVSNSAAAKKGGWQVAGAIAAGAFTLLSALWMDPTVAATVVRLVKDHPEWGLYFAVANVVFGFIRNRLAHRDPNSRLAIVGDPKAGSPADRRR
jgi:hypothetical protein